MRREGLRLIRTNPAYRLLWLAQAVSLAGDWFTVIALAVLVARRPSGAGLAVSGLVLVQLLPGVVIGPWSGVLADRFDRRRLLVASDLARSAIVLLLIPAAGSGNLLAIYALAFLHFAVSTVFEPTRSALMPRLVEPSDLVTASTIATVTWSVMTAVGGIVGGTALSLVGVAGAFVLDALTFLASAAFIAAIPSAATLARPVSGEHEAAGSAGSGFRDGLVYLARNKLTAAVLLAKGMNGIAIADVFLVIYATRLFPLGEDGARSVGLLWAGFGLGAILGPLLLNAMNDGTVARMRRLIAAAAVFLSASLFLLAAAPTLAVAGLAIVLRGMGGASTWTYSTIILQKTVPDRLQGRLFALDLANAYLLAMIFSMLWGAMMDRVGVRPAVLAAAGASLVSFVVWMTGLRRMERQARAAAVAT